MVRRLRFKGTELDDVTKLLVATALGGKKEDLVIKDATLVNVNFINSWRM